MNNQILNQVVDNNNLMNNQILNQVVDNNNLYMRFNNNQLLLLKDNIKKLYNINNIIITNSGLNANSIILEICKVIAKY
jgi:cystathionine beta-lyase/cystathionine gamma-synthase